MAGKPSQPPFGGIKLGVGAFSKHPDLAYDAAKCITSPEHQKLYMLGTGNPAANKTVYDDPAIKKQLPMAATDPPVPRLRGTAPAEPVLRRHLHRPAARVQPAQLRSTPQHARGRDGPDHLRS